MHEIEPYYGWRDDYIASEDKRSPFYKRQYNEFEYTQKIYNYYIHPQWDFFGSSTLYCKVLFADYETGSAVIELIGEWNDALHNDIMEFKRTLIDTMVKSGISKFILLGENVLNFHGSDDSYYEEWYEDVKDEGGWIIAVNFREHVSHEMQQTGLHHFLHLGKNYSDILWRKLKPANVAEFFESLLVRSIG